MKKPAAEKNPNVMVKRFRVNLLQNLQPTWVLFRSVFVISLFARNFSFAFGAPVFGKRLDSVEIILWRILADNF